MDGGEKQRKENLAWARKLLPPIPESVATIEDAWQAPENGVEKLKSLKVEKNAENDFNLLTFKPFNRSPGRLVYLIQDAHTNESAQINIAKTLDILLSSELGVRSSEKKFTSPSPDPPTPNYVFLEAGFGDDSLSFLRRYANPEKRKVVAMSFLAKGYIQGPDYLDLTSEHHFKLWGVENKALYFKGLGLYKILRDKREALNTSLDKVYRAIKSLKGKIYGQALLSFDEKRQAFLKNDISLTDYFDVLVKALKKLAIPIEFFPHVAALQKIKDKESKIDFKAANEEQARALESLAPEDQKILAQSRNSPSKLDSQDHKKQNAFYALLEEKITSSVIARSPKGDEAISSRRSPRSLRSLAMTEFPNLLKYIDYLKEVQKLDSKALLDEQQVLEQTIFNHLAESKDEAMLVQSSKSLETLRKLFNLTLTTDEFEAISRDPNAFDLLKIEGFLNRKIMDLESHYEDALFWDKDYEETFNTAKTFYSLTLERDEAFVRNVLEKLEERQSAESIAHGKDTHSALSAMPYANVAILVTGGFHTVHLKQLLKGKNISYVVVCPQVLYETNQKRYEDLLLGPISGSLGKKSKVNADHWSVEPAHDLEVVQNGARLSVLGMLERELGAEGAGQGQASGSIFERRPDLRASAGTPPTGGARLAQTNLSSLVDRIHRSSVAVIASQGIEAHGSGTVVARNRDTAYVLTTRHLLNPVGKDHPADLISAEEVVANQDRFLLGVWPGMLNSPLLQAKLHYLDPQSEFTLLKVQDTENRLIPYPKILKRTLSSSGDDEALLGGFQGIDRHFIVSLMPVGLSFGEELIFGMMGQEGPVSVFTYLRQLEDFLGLSGGGVFHAATGVFFGMITSGMMGIDLVKGLRVTRSQIHRAIRAGISNILGARMAEGLTEKESGWSLWNKLIKTATWMGWALLTETLESNRRTKLQQYFQVLKPYIQAGKINYFETGQLLMALIGDKPMTIKNLQGILLGYPLSILIHYFKAGAYGFADILTYFGQRGPLAYTARYGGAFSHESRDFTRTYQNGIFHAVVSPLRNNNTVSPWSQAAARLAGTKKNRSSGLKTEGWVASGRAFYSDHAGQNTRWLQTLRELLSGLKWLPLFVTSFIGIHPNTSEYHNHTQDTDSHSPKNWELLEKIARKIKDNHGLSYVHRRLRDEFYFVLGYFGHPIGLYHDQGGLSSRPGKPASAARLAVLKKTLLVIATLGLSGFGAAWMMNWVDSRKNAARQESMIREMEGQVSVHRLIEIIQNPGYGDEVLLRIRAIQKLPDAAEKEDGEAARRAAKILGDLLERFLERDFDHVSPLVARQAVQSLSRFYKIPWVPDFLARVAKDTRSEEVKNAALDFVHGYIAREVDRVPSLADLIPILENINYSPLGAAHVDYSRALLARRIPGLVKSAENRKEAIKILIGILKGFSNQKTLDYSTPPALATAAAESLGELGAVNAKEVLTWLKNYSNVRDVKQAAQTALDKIAELNPNGARLAVERPTTEDRKPTTEKSPPPSALRHL